MNKLIRTCLFLLFLSLAHCTERFVQPGATGGTGTSSSPFGSIQDALNVASSNDIITLYNGTYTGTPNTFLSLGSLTSITIRGFDDDPAKAVIQWMGASTVSFLNMSSNAPTVKLQGLGFTGRILADNSWGYTAPTIYVASGSLDINNCRFENFTTNSYDASEVLYVFVTKGATATIRNSNFIRGTGCFGIQLEQGNVSVSTSNFVSHTIVNPGGNCLSIKTAITTNAYFTVTNNNFVSSSTPLYFPKGNITLTGNGFYNCSNVVLCNPLQSTIITSGNKFCGSSTGSCSSVSVANIRPFDGCGICDGTNVNKDCNGVCWGTSRGSSCTTRKTIWVSSTGTGDGTVRNNTASISTAITQANYGDTIILLSGTYSGGINTAGKKGLTIRSENGIPDYDNVTISCDTGTKNAFTFSNGESFDTVIQGITITNCGDNYGATAVYIGANTGVTFQSVNFYKNGDLGTYGGAIYLLDGFVRTIDVTFQNNSAFQGSVVNGRASNNLTKATYFSATNARFLNNYADDRGALFFQGGLIEITNSYFSHNDAYLSAADLCTFYGLYLRLVNNSFSNSGLNTVSGPKAMTCGTLRNDSTQSLNTFCGNSTTVSISCSIFSPAPTISGSPNGCGVCGSVSSYDCAGTCFGDQVNGTTGCCYTAQLDCMGICNGNSVCTTTSDSSKAEKKEEESFGGPSLVGIIVGGAVALLLLIALIAFIVIRRRKELGVATVEMK